MSIMRAKYAGHCSKCGEAFDVGAEVSWSRQERGKVYHIACAPVRTPAPATPATLPDATVLAELLRKLMATPTPAPVEEQGEEVPSATPKPTPIPAMPKSRVTPVRLSTSTPWWVVLAAILAFVRRVLIIGPPSSGKSTTAMLLADIRHRITMTETTSREDLIGMHHLLAGETKFVGVNFTLAMKDGTPVLVDEIDRNSPECMSLAYSLMDDRPHINLPNGELVEAKEGYKVIMTTNENIETLPLAVQDRVEVVIMASLPHEAALEGEGITPAMREVCKGYYAGLPVPTVKLPPTVRRMRTFGKLLTNGIPNDVAARLVFGNAGAAEVLSSITSAERKGVR